MTTLHDFDISTRTGAPLDPSEYHGKAVLIVNTASKCGLTPQFKGLQELYDTYRERGFVILGFPCDQFAHQEPGTADEAAETCQLNYGVTFPMLRKIDVNGDKTDPVWAWLKEQKSGLGTKAIKWNFTKFLIAPTGEVVGRYAPTTTPEKLAADIERVLPA